MRIQVPIRKIHNSPGHAGFRLVDDDDCPGHRLIARLNPKLPVRGRFRKHKVNESLFVNVYAADDIRGLKSGHERIVGLALQEVVYWEGHPFLIQRLEHAVNCARSGM